MTKKFVSLFLALAMCLTLSVPAFAVDTSADSEIAFIDAEGKENVLLTRILENGNIVTEHFIEDRLIYTTETRTVGNDDDIIVVTINHMTGTTTTAQKKISDYITSQSLPAMAPCSMDVQNYQYQGRVTFLPCDNSYAPGLRHTHYLDFYMRENETNEEYRTFNALAGDIVSAVVNILWTLFVARFPIPLEKVEAFVKVVLESAGVTVISGVIQSAIKKTYYIRTTEYYIKAVNPDNSVEHLYSGEQYQILLDNDTYSSEYYYTGKMLWHTNSVLALIFPDFFSCPYPGLKSVS